MMPDFSDRWTKTMVSGGKPLALPGQSALPAVASADGKHSIVCLAHQLRVYFLQTRQCIRTVDVDVSKAVAVRLDPGSDSQIVVFTNTEILYVNWREKVDSPVVARQTLSPPIPGLEAVVKVADQRYFLAAVTGSTVSVHAVDRESAATCQVFELDAVRAYSVSADGHKLAVALDSGDVAVYDMSAAVASSADFAALDFAPINATIAATKELVPSQHRVATCMAVSNSGVVAVGSSSGAIHVLYTGTATGKPQRSLRWHVDPVRSVTFSADEVYLVSGGNEKVLVFWHLDSDRTQFLPRLSGAIDAVAVDAHRPDHYMVALRVADGAHELVTISAVDLISRLSVSPARPHFGVTPRRAIAATVKKHRAASAGKTEHPDTRDVRHDISAPVTVHPTTKYLYFAHGAAIQAYDVVRGEQAFVQHAAAQVSTGRVRSERGVEDPSVSVVAFTQDGQWMATVDAMPPSDFDNLMSRRDVAYALKFWRWVGTEWSLSSKIVDPHGTGTEVGAVLTPGGHQFTTVDKKGGIRVWRPRANHVGGGSATEGAAQPAKNAHKMTTQTVWTLRRASPPTATTATVAACYSADRSLLVVGHGTSVTIHDPESLRATGFRVPSMDSAVEYVAVAGSHLIMASSRRLVSYDLVSARETELQASTRAPGMANLVAVDHVRNLVAVAANQYFHSHSEFALRGKVYVFRPDSLTPLHTSLHNTAISSLVATSSGFLFVDADSRIGTISPEIRSAGADTPDDLAAQMSKMLVDAQATANVLFARSADESSAAEPVEDTEKWASHRAVDVAVLQPIFSNIEGVSLDSLFERVVRAVQ